MNDTCEAHQADKPLPGTIEAVRRALLANRANTLALVECLRVAQQERPFREAEELVADNSQAMALTFQSPHALYDILVNCGGVERTEVPEEEEEATSLRDGGESDAIAAEATVELPDQPTDYTLVITPAGAEALAEFEPTKRFSELLATEPANYADAYRRVLELCANGAKKDEIEQALALHDALQNPKKIYPGYFISKLETVDGITWDGAWRTTEAGRRMVALLS